MYNIRSACVVNRFVALEHAGSIASPSTGDATSLAQRVRKSTRSEGNRAAAKRG
jgi:hypothetical protein